MFARFETSLFNSFRSFVINLNGIRKIISSCCGDPGVKQIHEAQGSEEEINGVNTYKTGQGKSVIVMFTDIFGYSFINARKLADNFAQGTKTTVLIPDCFNGDPINPDALNPMDLLPSWLKRHPPINACHIADQFVSSIERNYQSIQIIGICYGGKIVVHLIKGGQFCSKMKCCIVAHPSFLIKEEAKQIEVPILFLCAEKDNSFPPDLRQEFEKELKSNGLGTFIDYPGTSHGFLIRPSPSQQVIQQRDKALQDAIRYFKNNL